MEKQCDLCNDKFKPPKVTAENARENRYCRLCCTDPYRRLMCQIHETIGISGYTIREINDLKSQNAALLAACNYALDTLETLPAKPQDGEIANIMNKLQSAIEQVGVKT